MGSTVVEEHNSSIVNSNGGCPGGEDVMRFESCRLSSFAGKWPSDAKVEARKVAKGGFYHTGTDANEVACSWCGCRISHWDYGDQVMARHRSESPNCPFILKKSNNVPLIQSMNTGGGGNENLQEPIDHPDGPSDPQRDTAVSSSSSDGTGGGSPSGGRNLSAAAPEVSYTDDAAPAGEQPLDLVQRMDEDISGNSSSNVVDTAGSGGSRRGSSTAPMVAPPSGNTMAAFSAAAVQALAPGLFDSPMALAQLKKESMRLRSFLNWPLDFIRPRDLAKSGFIYTGRRDCVRCVFCGEYVGEWDREDNPLLEHRNLFPHCPFMRGQDVGNVPIMVPDEGPDSADSDIDPITSGAGRHDEDEPMEEDEAGPLPSTSAGSSSSSRLRGADEVGIRPSRAGTSRDANSGPEKGPGVIRWTNSSCSTSGSSRDGEASSGIIRHSGPAHPKYSTVEARMRTFKDWPPALRQQPADLSDAGFYYIGLSDQVKCFYCDGGLRNWVPEDDPWTEHARWFAKCGFVRLVKGDEFIARCLAERPTQDNSQQPQQAAPQQQQQPSQSRVLRAEDIPAVMSSALVHQALSMGVDASRVKMALQRRVLQSLPMYANVNQLLDAAFREHREQEERVTVENNETPSAFGVGGAMTTASASVSAPSEDIVELRRRRESTSATTEGSQSQGEADIEEESSLTTGAETTSSQESQDEQPQQQQEQGSSSTIELPAADTSQPPPPSSASPTSSQPPTAAVLQHSSSAPLGGSESGSALSLPQSQSLHGAAIRGEANDLESENRRLKEQRTCKICMDNEIGVVFLPCGHLICCVQCAPALKDCPLCRQPIHGTVKTYMS